MPTSHLSPLELEGRMHGQRRILALLLAEAMARGDEAFAGRLEGLFLAPDSLDFTIEVFLPFVNELAQPPAPSPKSSSANSCSDLLIWSRIQSEVVL